MVWPDSMVSRTRRSMAEKDQGFTLIELLVVHHHHRDPGSDSHPGLFEPAEEGRRRLKSTLHDAAVILETWAIDNPGASLGWEDWWAPGPTTTGELKGLKISPGTHVWMLGSASTPGGWCVFANNANASKARDDPQYLVWRSVRGGLDPNVASTGAGPAYCE